MEQTLQYKNFDSSILTYIEKMLNNWLFKGSKLNVFFSLTCNICSWLQCFLKYININVDLKLSECFPVLILSIPSSPNFLLCLTRQNSTISACGSSWVKWALSKTHKLQSISTSQFFRKMLELVITKLSRIPAQRVF